MASSTRKVTGGNGVAVQTMKSRRKTRGSSMPTVLGIGLACLFWGTASLVVFKGLSSSTIQAPAIAGHSLPRPDLALSKPFATRPAAASADFAALDEMRSRFAGAIAATDHLGLLMLPAAMRLAEVDKSDRLLLARVESITDSQALAVLRDALIQAEAGRKQAALAHVAHERRTGVDDLDPVMTASIARETLSSAPAALGYAATPSAAETMAAADPREEPFEELLSEPQIEDHGALPDDGPVPGAKPQAKPRVERVPAPEAPVASETPEKPKKKTLLNMLAYAKPDNPITTDDGAGGIFQRKNSLPGPGSRIAVYVIEDAVVHMPNGEKLRAHSGRGHMRDNPKYVHMKNQGPTPPNVYQLRMREARFHGVEAIRMNPVGDARMYNRDGFLTHTYLLRRRGDSSGCVVFEDYNRFLNAYKRGHVQTLIVVPSMRDLPKYMAML
jgi:hypothetical protein